jgi:hypothetical protein
MELYHLLGDLEEILDEDFNDEDLERLQGQINFVKQNKKYHDLLPIAEGLEKYLEQELKHRPRSERYFLDRLNARWIVFRNRYITRNRAKSILTGGLLGLSIWELQYPIDFLRHLSSPEYILSQLFVLVNNELVTGPITSSLFVIRLFFDLILGISLAISVFLFLIKKDRNAVATAYICLIFQLTTLNLLLFYFDQFSMIINAGIQLFVLLLLLYYRQRYLQIEF